MLIEKSKFRQWSYRFKFDYDQSKVEFCRNLSKRLGYDNFGYADKCWWFNDPETGRILANKFPGLEFGAGFEHLEVERRAKLDFTRQREKENLARSWEDAKDFEVKNVKGTLYKYQKAAIIFMIKRSGRCFLALQPGCHSKGTKILKYNGDKVPVEDIQVGDTLMGPDSKPRKVLRLVRGKGKMYEINPIKGESFVVNEDHIMSFNLSGVKSINGIGGDFEMSIRDYVKTSSFFKAKTKLRRVAVQFPKADLPIDPYLLGIWLGDGCKNTIAITTPEPEIMDFLEKEAKKHQLRVRKVFKDNCYTCFLAREIHEPKSKNTLLTLFRESGCGFQGVKKKIPELYLRSSTQQRLKLLAGLLDTDGSMANNSFEFSSVNEDLAYQVQDLVRSLGLYAKVTKRTHKTNFAPGFVTSYRMTVSGETSMIPNLVARKKCTARRQKKSVLHTGFTVGELPEEDEYFGFTLDSDHLYLTADYFVNHNCGKTYISLGYAAHVGKKKILVVCPATVTSAWVSEVGKWTDYRPFIIRQGTFLTENDFDSHDVFIVSYDYLKTGDKVKIGNRTEYDFDLIKTLQKFKWDLLIGDEIHMVMNHSTVRYKAFKLMSQSFPSVLGLSGTPMVNRPHEVWAPMDCISHGWLGNYWDFAKRYCGMRRGRFGMEFTGDKDLSGLHEVLKPLMVRYEKEDVLPELPEKLHIPVPVEMDQSQMDEYKKIKESVLEEIADDPDAKPVTVVSIIMRLRQFTSKIKTEEAARLMEEIDDTGEKVIVFSSFNDPIKALAGRYGPKAVTIIGLTPLDERAKAVDRFMNDDSARFFLGGLKSAGAGITLTSSSNTIFIDQGWTPADMRQAMARNIRPGQKAEKVKEFTFFCPGTIDEEVMSLLESKAKEVDEIIDSKWSESEFGGSVMNELAKKYMELAQDTISRKKKPKKKS